MKKNKAFTLIELIAVLVILAILALIVTPLVMNIIKKARISADKRSIDAYGRSIELAIAGYLLDEGKFPSSINELTIEYSGDEVICSTTRLNGDSSVYLAECIVGGRTVSGYTYGKEEVITYDYQVGDEVTYNNVDYYVIKDSSVTEDSLTLLKAEPLTVDEVNTYGAGHVNRYTEISIGTAYDSNGYGGIAYYSSETCGYVNNNYVSTGCTTSYASSDIRYVVDVWKSTQAPTASDARLITRDEYLALTVVETHETPTAPETIYVPQYDWMYNNNYWYWTASPREDSSFDVWSVGKANGGLEGIYVHLRHGIIYGAVRPVITISKSALN